LHSQSNNLHQGFRINQTLKVPEICQLKIFLFGYMIICNRDLKGTMIAVLSHIVIWSKNCNRPSWLFTCIQRFLYL